MDGVIGFILFIVFCVVSVMYLRKIGLREKAIDNEFFASLDEARLALRYLDLVNDIANHTSPIGYSIVRGERFLGAFAKARNFDTKSEVDLIVTTKALVAQSHYGEDRITWSSVREFRIKRDGLEIFKSRGGRKAFQFEDPQFIALAEAAHLKSKQI